MSKFERMKRMHEERRAKQKMLSAQGVDFIAESRAGAIGRLVDSLVQNNPAYKRVPKVNDGQSKPKDASLDPSI